MHPLSRSCQAAEGRICPGTSSRASAPAPTSLQPPALCPGVSLAHPAGQAPPPPRLTRVRTIPAVMSSVGSPRPAASHSGPSTQTESGATSLITSKAPHTPEAAALHRLKTIPVRKHRRMKSNSKFLWPLHKQDADTRERDAPGQTGRVPAVSPPPRAGGAMSSVGRPLAPGATPCSSDASGFVSSVPPGCPGFLTRHFRASRRSPLPP